MEIKADGILNQESIKALVHFQMFRKNNPRKRIKSWTILYAILFLVLVVESFWIGMDDTVIVLLVCIVVVLLLEYFMYFISPKIQYNSLANMKDIVNEYVFTEESMLVVSKGEDYNSQGEIKYSVLVKMCETSRYLFLFQNKAQAFIVDKNTIRDGSIEEVREMIKSQMNGKYILCKY